jgi:hypothetical protein
MTRLKRRLVSIGHGLAIFATLAAALGAFTKWR